MTTKAAPPEVVTGRLEPSPWAQDLQTAADSLCSASVMATLQILCPPWSLFLH